MEKTKVSNEAEKRRALDKQLAPFYKELEGNVMGGILLFCPEQKLFLRVSYGTGDNLLKEDRREGYDDYIYISADSFDDGWEEEVEGGQINLKMEEEWNNHYNICQHVADVLVEMFDNIVDVIPLQAFTH